MSGEPADEERIVGSLNATLAAKLATKYDSNIEASVREWMSSLLSSDVLADQSQSLGDILHDGSVLCEFVFLFLPPFPFFLLAAAPRFQKLRCVRGRRLTRHNTRKRFQQARQQAVARSREGQQVFTPLQTDGASHFLALSRALTRSLSLVPSV